MAACCLAGAGASLTLPPFGVVPLIALLSWPALIIANAATTRRAALAGGLTGFGWFLASVWWISLSLVTGDTNYWPLLPLPLIGIPLILASFWVPAAALAHRLGRSTGARLGWLLLFLALCEWARGHVATGFPWNAPGYLFSANLPLLQSASLVGLYGLTVLALAVGLRHSGLPASESPRSALPLFCRCWRPMDGGALPKPRRRLQPLSR